MPHAFVEQFKGFVLVDQTDISLHEGLALVLRLFFLIL
jgi:hypothetical protein